jgi:hypothetical protein
LLAWRSLALTITIGRPAKALNAPTHVAATLTVRDFPLCRLQGTWNLRGVTLLSVAAFAIAASSLACHGSGGAPTQRENMSAGSIASASLSDILIYLFLVSACHPM